MTLPQVATDNLSSRVYAQLRSALMDGDFTPGERLRIKDLAQQLGTSITPVREAVFRLVSERALELKAATAVHVPILAADDLRQIQFIRLELEGAAAARACELITPEQIKRLERLQEGFVKAVAHDAHEGSRINREFHFELLAAAQMPLLTAVVENMWVMMGPLLTTFHKNVSKRQVTGKGHNHYGVIRGLKKGDATAVREAIQEDIRWGRVMIRWLEDEDRKAQSALEIA